MSDINMPKLVIALDYPNKEQALELAKACLQLDTKPWLKVGLELYVAEGPELIASFKKLGFNVFLDLKFHDIPNTVFGAVASAAKLGISMLNIHISGGEAMAKAAVLALKDIHPKPLLLGVTILTSTANAKQEEIVNLAKNAKAWGLDGVVCSGQEAASIKQACGKDFICLTPGIRPAAPVDTATPVDTASSSQVSAAQQNQDQVRVMTPEQAVLAGSDFLVVGRPITKDSNPMLQAQNILNSIKTTFTQSAS